MRIRTSPLHDDMAAISGDSRRRDTQSPLGRFSSILKYKYKVELDRLEKRQLHVDLWSAVLKDQADDAKARLREKSQEIHRRLEILNNGHGVPKYLYRVPIEALINIYLESARNLRQGEASDYRMGHIFEYADVPSAWVTDSLNTQTIIIPYGERRKTADYIINTPLEVTTIFGANQRAVAKLQQQNKALQCILGLESVREGDRETFSRADEKLREAAELANIEVIGEDYLLSDFPEELQVYWRSLWAELTLYLHGFWENCLREIHPSIIELQGKYAEVLAHIKARNTQRSLPPYLYSVDMEWLSRTYYRLARCVVMQNRVGFNSLAEVVTTRVTGLRYPISWIPRVSDDTWPPENQYGICYMSLLNTDQVRCRECRNILYQDCIRQWFEVQHNITLTCPFCRSRLGFSSYIDLTAPDSEPDPLPDALNDLFTFPDVPDTPAAGISDDISHNTTSDDTTSDDTTSDDTTSDDTTSDDTTSDDTASNSRNEGGSIASMIVSDVSSSASIAGNDIPFGPEEENRLPGTPSIPTHIRRERRAIPPRRVVRVVRPGFPNQGDEIIACENRYGAIVRDNNGSHLFLTVAESGGKAVIDAAVGLPSIGWSRTLNIERISEYSIDRVAVGTWNIYSKRLPRVLCIFFYIEDGTRYRSFVSLSSLKTIFGLAAEYMVVESLAGDDTLTLERALETVFDITHAEREAYWQAES
ncbi:hypothetical protein TMEN_5051 [Trichophyton mentagrophytes]|nr:hypothetical protein TMEN_5051 [Trichophyton mentagrophytes]